MTTNKGNYYTNHLLLTSAIGTKSDTVKSDTVGLEGVFAQNYHPKQPDSQSRPATIGSPSRRDYNPKEYSPESKAPNNKAPNNKASNKEDNAAKLRNLDEKDTKEKWLNQPSIVNKIKAWDKKDRRTTVENAAPIRLSFQLMTRAEPVAMVIETIKSLLAIKAPSDEILIVDNNHTKAELYEPLEEFCHSLDPKQNVHFYHIDAVAGFKAGALNLALGLMDPHATHVVVVDSDYHALPHARDAITRAIRRHPKHTLLQFPQFYRDTGRVDVHSELNHYFNYHLYRPFNRERALSTGTFAIIRRDALIKLGGWSGASITEDAQMGVLMHKQGLRSQFVPEVIATGLLPTTIADLMSQRQRWIYGNMQVLDTYVTDWFKRFYPADKSSSRHSQQSITTQDQDTRERLAYVRAHLSQLSAWINFTGIFILLHIATLLLIGAVLLTGATVNLPVLLTPLYVVYISYGLFLARRLWAYLHDDAPLNQQVDGYKSANKSEPSFGRRLHAWALHLNFWELGALSWLPVLWGRDKPFVCTPKLDDVRTRRSALIANIMALPKGLLVLNIITAIIVAPFSLLYSPLLFVCALSVVLLKLWAASVMMTNYRYREPTSSQKQIVKKERSVNTAFKQDDVAHF